MGRLTTNNSLLGIHLSRKDLTDADALEIGAMIKQNQKLQKLELEGNRFGAEGLKLISKELAQSNTTIRYLDLENNPLTGPAKQDVSGIEELAEMLLHNQKLLVMNLGNTGLTAQSGHLISEAMKENKTLISLEISGNDLPVEEIRSIQDSLMRNKKAYDEERLREFKERKMMNEEDSANKNLMDAEDKKKEELELQDKNKKARLEERETKFTKMVLCSLAKNKK